jgi:hypothetical protein
MDIGRIHARGALTGDGEVMKHHLSRRENSIVRRL